MSLERNRLEREIKLARKKVRKKQANYDALRHQAEEALTAVMSASTALCALEVEQRSVVRREEDLAGKHGPLLELSTGTWVLEGVVTNEPWIKTFSQVRIWLSALGTGHTSPRNIDLRVNGRYGDTFTDEDVAEVLLVLPKIEGGEQALALFMSWGKP